MTSYRARVRIAAPGKSIADSIYSALAPDLKRLPGGESSAEISLRGREIILKVETGDIVDLRASLNSYIRLADASYRCTTL